MAENPNVLLDTTEGEILIELYPDKAPETVANFLKYVDEGFYKNTIFHRVIKGFMIQGGGLTMKMEEKPTSAPVKNEADNVVLTLTLYFFGQQDGRGAGADDEGISPGCHFLDIRTLGGVKAGGIAKIKDDDEAEQEVGDDGDDTKGRRRETDQAEHHHEAQDHLLEQD